MNAQRKSAIYKRSSSNGNGCTQNGNTQHEESQTPNGDSKGPGSGGTKLERTLSLVDGTCFVVSCVIGAGIFISPTNVLKQVPIMNFPRISGDMCAIEIF